jgi:hypothetical protein
MMNRAIVRYLICKTAQSLEYSIGSEKRRYFESTGRGSNEYGLEVSAVWTFPESLEPGGFWSSAKRGMRAQEPRFELRVPLHGSIFEPAW